MTVPTRLPDAASLERVLAGLEPALADADLVPALTAAFPALHSALHRSMTIIGATPDRCFDPTARGSANCALG